MTLRPLLCALTLLAGAPALAQEPAPKQEPAPVAAQPATMNDDLKVKFVAQAPEEVVASKLIGTTIRNGANESIGSVADIVFDDKRAVKSYVVSVGGFLGLNAQYVAVAPETLKLSRKDNGTLDAVIDTDKDQLRAAPEYVYLGSEPKK